MEYHKDIYAGNVQEILQVYYQFRDNPLNFLSDIMNSFQNNPNLVNNFYIIPENRDEKLRRVVHAEMNALKYLKPGEGFLLATTSSPCSNCLPIICSYGIKKIVFETYYNRDNYVDQLCREFGIELEQRKINSLLLQNLM